MEPIVYGSPVDEGAFEQIKACLEGGAVHSCLMADHHKGYKMPIGGVCAYEDQVTIEGCGYDIGCGNKAVRLDMSFQDIKNVPELMDEIYSTISFGIGLKNKEEVDHPLFDSDAWSIPVISDFKDLARQQLGTIGSGNHFVDLFRDEQDNVWIGVHFGSRGFGHKTATGFLNLVGAKDGMDGPPILLDVNKSLGAEYVECMNLAGQYAYAGRDWVCSRIAKILGANILEEVHNHHNFAWKETHFGKDYWVVRKGATPAFPGQKGFIGGSMGDNSVIIEGVDSAESRNILHSTVHGAGRVMSRTQAAGKMNYKTRQRSGGVITREMMNEWINSLNVELRGGGTDESPHVYKRLENVLSFHASTIKVLHTLTPFGVCMAGENEIDPYKD